MKIKIETYGCAANKVDSDIMKNLLSENYEVIESGESDIIIVNSCGVKSTTEEKIISHLRALKNKKVIIAGCLPHISWERLNKEFPNFSMIGPNQVWNIKEIVDKVSKGKRVLDLSKRFENRFIKKGEVSEVEIVKIAQGCLGDCSYCATKKARGNLKSYSPQKIVNYVKRIVKSGAKVIHLTSQDNGCYGLDIETNLPLLLEELCKIEGDFKIKVGMMNPQYALKFQEELIKVFKNPKIIKFIHIPVQSGNNEILKKMRRNYSVEQFEHLIKRFREEIPNLEVWTDIICGFPGETEEQFRNSIRLLNTIKPSFVNITKFYSRPCTDAKKMKQLPSQVIKRRSKLLSEVWRDMKAKTF